MLAARRISTFCAEKHEFCTALNSDGEANTMSRPIIVESNAHRKEETAPVNGAARNIAFRPSGGYSERSMERKQGKTPPSPHLVCRLLLEKRHMHTALGALVSS